MYPIPRTYKNENGKNNVGFEFMGQDILHSKKSDLKEILF